MTISRTEEHEIDSAGRRLLVAELEKLGWVVNKTTDDYAVDYLVQVFEPSPDGHSKAPSGVWFKVQLKSSRNTNYSQTGKFISQKLRADHLRHFGYELRDPIFVFHADIKLGKLYWHAPQMEPKSERPQDDAKVTIRIPTVNEFPISLSNFLHTIYEIYGRLAIRTVTSIGTREFVEAVRFDPDYDSIRSALKRKHDALRLHAIAELVVTADLDNARPRALSLINDPDADVEDRCYARYQLGQIDYMDGLLRYIPQGELPKVRLQCGRDLCQIAEEGPLWNSSICLNCQNSSRTGSTNPARRRAADGLAATHAIGGSWTTALSLA